MLYVIIYVYSLYLFFSLNLFPKLTALSLFTCFLGSDPLLEDVRVPLKLSENSIKPFTKDLWFS